MRTIDLPRRVLLPLFVAAGLLCAPGAHAQVDVAGGDLRVRVDQTGQVVRLSDTARGREYLATGQPAPLLAIKIAGTVQPPTGMTCDATAGILALSYGATGVRVRVKATPKPTHLVLEVLQVEPTNVVDAVIWGPYPTTIGDTVGEIIGVVRGRQFAIGLQVLNIRTLDQGGLTRVLRPREGQLAPHGRHRGGTDQVPRGLGRRAMDPPRLRAWRVRHPGGGARGECRGREAPRPSVQGVLSDHRAAGRDRAEPGEVVQRDGREPHGLRRPRGVLGIGPGRLRARAVREGLLRQPRSLGGQRHEHIGTVLLAHQHVLQLGRAVVWRIPREHAGIPHQQPGPLRSELRAPHARVVPADCDDEPAGDGMDARPRGRVRRGVRDVDDAPGAGGERRHAGLARCHPRVGGGAAIGRVHRGPAGPDEEREPRVPPRDHHARSTVDALPLPRVSGLPPRENRAAAW